MSNLGCNFSGAIDVEREHGAVFPDGSVSDAWTVNEDNFKAPT